MKQLLRVLPGSLLLFVPVFETVAGVLPGSLLLFVPSLKHVTPSGFLEYILDPRFFDYSFHLIILLYNLRFVVHFVPVLLKLTEFEYDVLVPTPFVDQAAAH